MRFSTVLLFLAVAVLLSVADMQPVDAFGRSAFFSVRTPGSALFSVHTPGFSAAIARQAARDAALRDFQRQALRDAALRDAIRRQALFGGHGFQGNAAFGLQFGY